MFYGILGGSDVTIPVVSTSYAVGEELYDLYRSGDVVVHMVVDIIYPAWHVDGDVASSGDGRTWPTAFKTIQEAIDSAVGGEEIWVKMGTYPLSVPIDVDKAVAIYGGFAGVETNRFQRDWQTNITTVDGQGSVYHCFEVWTGTIDGFTVTGGNANGTSVPDNLGGAMYIPGEANIANCRFSGNSAISGGAIYTYYHYSANIDNCEFSGNTANIGGAISNVSSEPNITNCIFRNNTAISGGAIFNSSESGPTINGCIFETNQAEDNGGRSTIASCSSPPYPSASFRVIGHKMVTVVESTMIFLPTRNLLLQTVTFMEIVRWRVAEESITMISLLLLSVTAYSH